MILSGSSNDKYTGVGFIISPGLRRAVHSFDCKSARMAAIKIRVTGGKIAFLSTYAPQNAYSSEVRAHFFNQ